MNLSTMPAGFVRRLSAAVIDFGVLALFMATFGWMVSLSQLSAQALFLPLCLIPWLYTVLLHARFGMTLGKMVLGIRVVCLNGSPIGFREALRRSSVDAVFYAHWTACVAIAIWSLSPSAFNGQGWFSLFQLLKPHFPESHEFVELASSLWGWSEFVTMLFNRRRRALHDLIAGTIVVQSAAAAPNQSLEPTAVGEPPSSAQLQR